MRIDTAEEVEALLNDADGDVAACSADRLFNQAVTHHEAGEWGLALRGFSTVLRLEPGRADAAFNIATILQMLGFTRLAVDYTEKVCQDTLTFPKFSRLIQPAPPPPLPPDADPSLALQ